MNLAMPHCVLLPLSSITPSLGFRLAFPPFNNLHTTVNLKYSPPPQYFSFMVQL